MIFSDLIKETYLSLLSNKSRSFLTILGIVIGIASVIVMISIGHGASKNIEENIQSLGTNLLVVMPGSQSGPGNIVRGGMGSSSTLTIQDAEYIKEQILNINNVAPEVSTRKQIIFKQNNTNTSVYGVNIEYQAIKKIEMESGTFLKNEQITKFSKVAVLGSQIRDDLFGENIQVIGQKIKIDKQEFTIIGVTKTKGGTGMGSLDDRIYVPISTAQHYLTGGDSISAINLEVSKEELMEQVQNEVTGLLLVRHKIKNNQPDFSIINQADIMDTMSSISDTLTLLLGSIAGISLLVGGIGIMNMMLTIVTERTREIGLRKSLGARRKDISRQFLTEAIALTLIGGIVGILLGCTISILINKFAGMTTSITPSSIFLAFGVAATIGIIFGYYPARRASKLSPINALRYE